MDIGLHRAGWTAVSFSEIEPYPSAVLASRWPGVPNLGDIVQLAGRHGLHGSPERDGTADRAGAAGGARVPEPVGLAGSADQDTGWHLRDARHDASTAWHGAYLWAGGPPCQDLSVAGKRRGLAGERSGLALVWFDLVERYRPSAVLLENVPGLLSSHRGRDMATLCGRLAELGYGWAYRTLDARYFGVPQRRRRVFLLALHARTGLGADGAAEVLTVGSRCRGHLAAGAEEGSGAATGTRRSSDGALGEDIVGTIPAALGHHGYTLGEEVYQGHLVAATLNSGGNDGGFRTEPGEHLVIAPTLSVPRTAAPGDTVPNVAYGKLHRASSAEDHESWDVAEVASTLNGMDGDYTTLPGGVRRLTPVECERLQGWPDGHTIPNEWKGKRYDGSDLLPVGLDSHRYRAIGNGVAAPVAAWIGRRLAAAVGVVERAA
jgi:DNA (cytosine-5)-methyltransferase 1